MVKLSTNLETVWPSATCDRAVDLDSKRCECKCIIVLANVLFEFSRKRMEPPEQVPESSRRLRNGRQLHLTLKAARAKEEIVTCGLGQLFRIKVKCMAFSAIYIHRAKCMSLHRLPIRLSSCRNCQLGKLCSL